MYVTYKHMGLLVKLTPQIPYIISMRVKASILAICMVALEIKGLQVVLY